MRVGILEIMALPSQYWTDTIYNTIITKQFASVTPQAISVWCRQLGHKTFYSVYYGVGDAHTLLPQDLNIVFVSCYTQASPIAYALAKIYHKTGTRTVIGGPHAKSFPVDSLRFFDLVVKECDKALIADILAGNFNPGSYISSARPFDDLPSVEERMPEIRASALFRGKWPAFYTVVPMLSSMGCPYKCNFCTDWDSSYRLLSGDRLAADLRYLAKEFRGAIMGFHDPNFAIKFDKVFNILESVPPESRIPYMMECSMSTLRGSRIKRLKETYCIAALPGIESWTDNYSKTGFGRNEGVEKVYQTVEHFQLLYEHVPYLQANFIFGLDADIGDGPITLTKKFIDNAPFVWPAINIPVPFGGTPLFKQYCANGRLLKALPFCFYYAPYLVTTLKNYDPVAYYERLIDLFSFASSKTMLKRRMEIAPNWKHKIIHWGRTFSTKIACNNNYRRILDMLRSDPQFRAFHEGQSEVLPEFYRNESKRILGPYARLLSRADMVPNLEQMKPLLSGKSVASFYTEIDKT